MFVGPNEVTAAVLKFYYAYPEVSEKFTFGYAEWLHNVGWTFNLNPPTEYVDPQKFRFTDFEGEVYDYYSLALESKGNPYNELPQGIPLSEWVESYQAKVRSWEEEKLRETAERYRISCEEAARIRTKKRSMVYPLASGYEFE